MNAEDRELRHPRAQRSCLLRRFPVRFGRRLSCERFAAIFRPRVTRTLAVDREEIAKRGFRQRDSTVDANCAPGTSGMGRLTINLLGSLQLQLDGRAAAGFQYAKVCGLLAFVAVEAGRPHRREVLASLLWPEQPGKACARPWGSTSPMALSSRPSLAWSPRKCWRGRSP